MYAIFWVFRIITYIRKISLQKYKSFHWVLLLLYFKLRLSNKIHASQQTERLSKIFMYGSLHITAQLPVQSKALNNSERTEIKTCSSAKKGQINSVLLWLVDDGKMHGFK